MDNQKKWVRKDSNVVYKNKILKIVEHKCFLPSKNIDNLFYTVDLPDWVNVFPLTRDGKVLTVKQHRVSKDIITHEVPAGAIDPGEKPIEAALRELQEETGYYSKNIKLLKEVYVNPAIQSNTCYVFIALDCEKISETDFDDTEELELEIMDIEDVFRTLDQPIIENSLNHLSIITSRDYIRKNL